MSNYILKCSVLSGIAAALIVISSSVFSTGNNVNNPACSEPIVGTWSCLASRVPSQSAPLVHTFMCDGTAIYQSQSTVYARENATPLSKTVGSRGIGQGYWKKIDKDLYVVGTDEYMYDMNSNYNGIFKVLVKIKYDKNNDGLRGSAITRFFDVTNVGTNHTDIVPKGSTPKPSNPLPVWTCDPADEGNTSFGVGTFPLGRIKDAQSDFFGLQDDLPIPELPGQ